MEDKKVGRYAEGPYTSVQVYKTTRTRIHKAKGRGVSVDRYINDLMDMVSRERKESKERKESGEQKEQKTGDNNQSLR